MVAHQVRHLSITVDVPLARAYTFASIPANFPLWAAGLSSTLHETERGWIADTPTGQALVVFSQPNDHGVLDHSVRMAGKPDVYIPLRMIENGSGTEVIFTLLRQPEMDDAMFDRDAALVAKDLETLKALLENQADG